MEDFDSHESQSQNEDNEKNKQNEAVSTSETISPKSSQPHSPRLTYVTPVPLSTGWSEADEDVPEITISAAGTTQSVSLPNAIGSSSFLPMQRSQYRSRPSTPILSSYPPKQTLLRQQKSGELYDEVGTGIEQRDLHENFLLDPEDKDQMKKHMKIEELVISVMQENDITNGGEEGVFESFFDLTRPRLKFIFTALDELSTQKAAGIADYQNLRNGLKNAGIEFRDEESFLKLVRAVDMDLDGGITFNEFETVVQSLKMGHIFRYKEARKVPSFRCINYNVAVADSATITSSELHKFMYSPRPPSFPQRWISVTTPADFTLKALAVKYRLHPLALEDALVNDPHVRAKVDSYDNHLLIGFPILSIVDRTNASNPKVVESVKPLESYGSFYSSGSISNLQQPLSANHHYTRIKPHSSDDVTVPDKNNPYNIPKLRKSNAFIFVTRPDLNTAISVVPKECGDVFKRARRELTVSYSRLRAYDAMYLTYTLLDVIVDTYAPIICEFESALAHIRDLLRKQSNRSIFDRTDVFLPSHYHDLMQELGLFKRWVVPGQRVLRHLLEDVEYVQSECKIYLSDVKDNLNQIYDDIISLEEGTRALKEEHRQLLDSKMTSTMNGLTIVATAFLPGQFLTGVFGMNFEDMPELHWRYGYPLFWVSCIISWIVLFSFFKSRKYI